MKNDTFPKDTGFMDSRIREELRTFTNAHPAPDVAARTDLDVRPEFRTCIDNGIGADGDAGRIKDYALSNDC